MTDRRIELDEGGKALLDEKLRLIEENIQDGPEIVVTWFKPDMRKIGGAYMQKADRVKKLDPYTRSIIFADGMAIRIEDISDIQIP